MLKGASFGKKKTAIKELLDNIEYLESLETIVQNFMKFLEMVKTKCLKGLLLDETSIKELPSNIGCLEYLETISLQNC